MATTFMGQRMFNVRTQNHQPNSSALPAPNSILGGTQNLQMVKQQLAQNNLKSKVKRKPQPQAYSTRTNGFGIPAVFNKTAQKGEH